jgi:hypothetical protein
LGSEDVVRPDMVMADWDVFMDCMATLPLADVIQRLYRSAYKFLPRDR